MSSSQCWTMAWGGGHPGFNAHFAPKLQGHRVTLDQAQTNLPHWVVVGIAGSVDNLGHSEVFGGRGNKIWTLETPTCLLPPLPWCSSNSIDSKRKRGRDIIGLPPPNLPLGGLGLALSFRLSRASYSLEAQPCWGLGLSIFLSHLG